MMEKKIIRRLNPLNRITIPIEWCEKLQFQRFQEVEVIVEYGKISIKKYNNQDISNLPYFGVTRIIDINNRLTIPKGYVRICNLVENLILELKDDKIQIYMEC